MQPIRKYDLTVARPDKNSDKKWYDKVGEIIVWPTQEGGERLQTRLFMFPDLDLATFEQKPREAKPESYTYKEMTIEDIPF